MKGGREMLGAATVSGGSDSPMDREISRILGAPDVRSWVKIALQAALERDPIDAAQDAALLADLLGRRADQVRQEGCGT
jgi:hypothetical protein